MIDWQAIAENTIQFNAFGEYLGLAITNPFLFALITAIAVDVLSGISASILNRKLDSSVGFKGIVKHTTLLLLGIILEFSTTAIGVRIVGNTFCVLAVGNYIISILGNLAVLGFYIPEWIAKPLEAEIERKMNKHN